MQVRIAGRKSQATSETAIALIMLCIISEDAKDGKGTKEETLALESLRLVARLDGLFEETLSIEDVDQGTRDEDDEEDEELHGYIITCCPANARACTGFLVNLS